MVSETAGRYRIEISRFEEEAPTGKYFVKTVEIRDATKNEIKTARLRSELLSIAAKLGERIAPNERAKIFKSYILDNALMTNSTGGMNDGAGLIKNFAADTSPGPKDYSAVVEIFDVHIEDFGETVVLNVRKTAHIKFTTNTNVKRDDKTTQRVTYIFKRVNSDWKVIESQRTYIDRERKTIKLDAKQLDAFVGEWDAEGMPSGPFKITRDGDKLFRQYGEAPKGEMQTEDGTNFWGGGLTTFIRDSNGTVTHAVVYFRLPVDRMYVAHKVK